MPRARAITMTPREFDALLSAVALYSAEYEGTGEDDHAPGAFRRITEDIRAHDRLIGKWYAAGRRPTR